jgi:hypothetical protein
LRQLWQTSSLMWSVRNGSAWKGRCRHYTCCYQLPMGLSDLSGCNSPPPPRCLIPAQITTCLRVQGSQVCFTSVCGQVQPFDVALSNTSQFGIAHAIAVPGFSSKCIAAVQLRPPELHAAGTTAGHASTPPTQHWSTSPQATHMSALRPGYWIQQSSNHCNYILLGTAFLGTDLWHDPISLRYFHSAWPFRAFAALPQPRRATLPQHIRRPRQASACGCPHKGSDTTQRQWPWFMSSTIYPHSRPPGPDCTVITHRK